MHRNLIFGITIALLLGLSAVPIRSDLGGYGENYNNNGDAEYSYVTDGLEVMWDFEWNAGVGVHDPNMTDRILNLATGNYGTISGYPPQSTEWEIGNNYISSFGGEARITASSLDYTDFMQSDYKTYEMVMDFQPTDPSLWDMSHYMVKFSTSYNSLQYRRGEKLAYIDGTYISWGWSPTQVTIVRDGDVIYCYNNGVLKRKVAASTNPKYPTAPRRTEIGDAMYGEMKVHSIRLYSRALTEEEIAQNYEYDKWRFGL